MCECVQGGGEGWVVEGGVTRAYPLLLGLLLPLPLDFRHLRQKACHNGFGENVRVIAMQTKICGQLSQQLVSNQNAISVILQ